jgi:hypothetical protein
VRVQAFLGIPIVLQTSQSIIAFHERYVCSLACHGLAKGVDVIILAGKKLKKKLAI